MALRGAESKGDVMSFLSDLGSIAKSVVHSPITKIVAGGIAIIAPPIGGPALAGIAAADKITAAIDKGKALVSQAGGVVHDAGAVFRSGVPGGAPAITRPQLSRAVAQGQAKIAIKAVAATAALAKSGHPDAQRNLKIIQLVQAAKQGQPKAQALLHQEIKKQVNHVLSKAHDPKATAEEKKLADLTGRLLKATVARKQYARKFAVNTRTARVHRVA